MRVTKIEALGIDASDEPGSVTEVIESDAQSRDDLKRALALGVGVEHDIDLSNVVVRGPWPRLDHAVNIEYALENLVEVADGNHDGRGGRGARREGFGNALLAKHRFRLDDEAVVLRETDIERGHARGECAENGEARDRDDDGALAYSAAELAPRAARDHVGRAVAGHERPEEPAAKHHERGGEHDERVCHRDDDAHGTGEAQRAVTRELTKQQSG